MEIWHTYKKPPFFPIEGSKDLHHKRINTKIAKICDKFLMTHKIISKKIFFKSSTNSKKKKKEKEKEKEKTRLALTKEMKITFPPKIQ